MSSLLDELVGWKRLFVAAVEQKFRNRLNLIAGAGVSIVAADNATDERTDLTIAATGSVGHTIQDTGDPMTQRTNLNFVGATVEDDSANDATKVTFAGSAGHIIEDGEAVQNQRAYLSFWGFDVVDNEGDDRTEIYARVGGSLETIAGFTMPAVGSTVLITTTGTRGLAAGDTLEIATAGWFSIDSVEGDGTSIYIENLGDPRNAAPSTVIGSGQRIGTSCSGDRPVVDGTVIGSILRYDGHAWVESGNVLLPSGAAREIGITTLASGTGSDLEVHGQDVTTGAGGDLVIRPGYGSVSNGVLEIKTATGSTVFSAEHDGSNQLLGFFGVTRTERPELPVEASLTAQNIADALVALGLCTQAVA